MLCFYTPRRILQLSTASEDFLGPQGHLETPLSAREKSESPHKSSQDHARHSVGNIAVKKAQEILRAMC